MGELFLNSIGLTLSATHGRPNFSSSRLTRSYLRFARKPCRCSKTGKERIRRREAHIRGKSENACRIPSENSVQIRPSPVATSDARQKYEGMRYLQGSLKHQTVPRPPSLVPASKMVASRSSRPQVSNLTLLGSLLGLDGSLLTHGSQDDDVWTQRVSRGREKEGKGK